MAVVRLVWVSALLLGLVWVLVLESESVLWAGVRVQEPGLWRWSGPCSRQTG